MLLARNALENPYFTRKTQRSLVALAKRMQGRIIGVAECPVIFGSTIRSLTRRAIREICAKG
jgi:hypothetical protein